MNDNNKITAGSALAWAVLTLMAFGLMVAANISRGFDIYDISAGIRSVTESSLILIGGHIVFAWSGVALVFTVVAIFPAGERSYPARVGAAFGLIAGSLFLLYGLVGGMGFADLSYIQSVRSADYISNAYLPLAIIANRILATAVTVLGLWLALTNLHFLQARRFAPIVAYLGLAAGAVALLGFIMPGGGFSLLALLLAIFWGFLVGLQLRRQPTLIDSPVKTLS